jgi:hypothetical protein
MIRTMLKATQSEQVEKSVSMDMIIPDPLPSVAAAAIAESLILAQAVLAEPACVDSKKEDGCAAT